MKIDWVIKRFSKNEVVPSWNDERNIWFNVSNRGAKFEIYHGLELPEDPLGDGSEIAFFPLNGVLEDKHGNYSLIPSTSFSYEKSPWDVAVNYRNKDNSYYLKTSEKIRRNEKKEITISGWIYLVSGCYEWNSIWHLSPDDNDNTGNSRQPALWLHMTYQRNFHICCDCEKYKNYRIEISSGKLHYNRWSFIVQTVSLTSMKLYINGILTDVLNTNSSTGNFLFNDGYFYIGDKWYNKSLLIANVRVFLKELSSEEISYLYELEKPFKAEDEGKKVFVFFNDFEKMDNWLVDYAGNGVSVKDSLLEAKTDGQSRVILKNSNDLNITSPFLVFGKFSTEECNDISTFLDISTTDNFTNSIASIYWGWKNEKHGTYKNLNGKVSFNEGAYRDFYSPEFGKFYYYGLLYENDYQYHLFPQEFFELNFDNYIPNQSFRNEIFKKVILAFSYNCSSTFNVEFVAVAKFSKDFDYVILDEESGNYELNGKIFKKKTKIKITKLPLNTQTVFVSLNNGAFGEVKQVSGQIPFFVKKRI